MKPFSHFLVITVISVSSENSSNQENVRNEEALINGGKLYARINILIIYFFFAGLPTQVSFLGTFLTTTAPNPIVAFFETLILLRMSAPIPI